MALRTIEAPFVEINEYDKSSYTKSMTGSSVLLMGFADHGQDSVTNYITSKNSWITYYGKPTNEAERYFYTASMEVLNQGGKLYASKLPYNNSQCSSYYGYKYQFTGTYISSLSNNVDISSLTDESIDKFIEISTSQKVSVTNEKVDDYVKGLKTDLSDNTFVIIDRNKTKVSKDSKKREVIGILPVITTPFNALYVQRMFDNTKLSKVLDKNIFNSVSKISRDEVTFDNEQDFNISLGTTDNSQTLSKIATQYFSTIGYEGTKYNKKYLNKIGVVVFQMYVDTYNGGKIGFTPVESFIGGFDKDEIDSSTNSSTFIDRIVNTNSQYIYLFSNISSDEYINGVKAIHDSACPILGFSTSDCKKEISYDKMKESIDKILEKNNNIIEKDIDIICDAGITNIAQFVKGGQREYTPDSTDWSLTGTGTYDGVETWKTIRNTIDRFCRSSRKDCMFILDAPRTLVLDCKQPIIRETKPENTIDINILPYINKITGYETSYTAGYSNWFEIADDITGDLFWCPPSIAAMGVYINCDLNANYWDAPAGLNRGKITVNRLSFNPSIAQAGELYQKGWNYAINWADVGPTIEGQHTLQVQPTAFDRVNVRRLFLRLERQAFKIARYFVYEGNTSYTRQRLVDTLDPIFKNVKTNDGIYDYKIICDETINTPEVIDNNELRVKIGIKPVKTAEFIIIDFYALANSGSFDEII